ncbi:hypothetical protein [uncultured Photobacterium sp.]|uniref:hypothetical protein n=1 Tax=uncultured Photobacterium sp. TaxID=173973 RepID=UPI002615E04E|nr:hypothetical protein [uncultured Photobacterium sp.]
MRSACGGRATVTTSHHSLHSSVVKTTEESGSVAQMDTLLGKVVASAIKHYDDRLENIGKLDPWVVLGVPKSMMSMVPGFTITRNYDHPSLTLSCPDNESLRPRLLTIYPHDSDYMACLQDTSGELSAAPLSVWDALGTLWPSVKSTVRAIVNQTASGELQLVAVLSGGLKDESECLDRLLATACPKGELSGGDDTDFALGYGADRFVIYRPFEEICLYAKEFNDRSWQMYLTDGDQPVGEAVLSLPHCDNPEQKLYRGAAARVRVAIRDGSIVRIYHHSCDLLLDEDDCHFAQDAAQMLR